MAILLEPCFPDDVDLLRVLKQRKYVWNSPKNQLAILLEPCFPERCGPSARVEAAEVRLEFTQGRAVLSRGCGPLRVLKQLKYVWNSPKNQLAILLEPCFPERCGPSARVQAAEVRLEFTQEWAVLSRTMWTVCAC